VVGVSSLAAGHSTLVPALIDELRRLDRSEILVVVGGVVPPEDQDPLIEAGVAAIFGPGSAITDSASRLLDVLEES
jgi:methylmalonyl-CoA mutase